MKYIFGLFIALVALNGWGRNLSPLDWGFEKAATPIERFHVLQAVHAEAVKKGVDVNYSGMPNHIEIEIPDQASSIQLTDNNNFKGIIFEVRNKRKELFLFERKGILEPIELSKQEIDDADFRKNRIINKDKCLVVVEDANYWTERVGYGYSVKRKDILLVENGIGVNKVIQPYNNEYSLPKCSYRYVNDEKTVVKNLTVKRSKDSTQKTYVLKLANLNDVRIEGIDIETPEGNMYGDMALGIYNCTNVKVKDINIKGTYSQKGKFGYGIHMENVYCTLFKNLNASALWGIFGTNNLSEVTLEKCDINRFDIHCYGRNVYCKNTTFHTLYNQFSSFYGELTFKKCRFENFIPVLLEPSFNAYTDFQLNLIDCKWEVNESRNYLLHAGQLGDVPNRRKELEQKFLPAVYLKNLEIAATVGVKEVYLFKPGTVSTKNQQFLVKKERDGLKFMIKKKEYNRCKITD